MSLSERLQIQERPDLAAITDTMRLCSEESNYLLD